ncbi:MAG: MATE family efflux transporter [Cellulosilyticum sp.]|nr:MATE family efflux transporter [Cellulosilyticum sp.]
MTIQLSDHFTYKKLIRFVLPSIIMMIFTSIYSVVDGLFVSNFVGKVPFAAVNLILPFVMILGSVGFMLGTGGSALVAKTLGEGHKEKANQYFSFLIIVALVSGIVFAVLGIAFLKPIATLLGAEGEMLAYCVVYGRILLLALPAFMLQNMFQSFLVTAEKPNVGLAITVAAGLTNIVLDAFFIAVLDLGIIGAAAATAISQMIGGIIPLIYFARKNKSLLKFTKTQFMGDVLIKASSNGASEFLTNVSMSLVCMLYNFQLMRMVGENGIAAYGVIMYVQFIFLAIFIGYSIGTAPLIGFNFGASNHKELKNVLKKSLILITLSGIVLMITAFIGSNPLAKVFVGYDQELFELTARGFKFYAVSFLLCGFSIFGSAFFTALNNGLISAVISFLRTVVFQVAAVLILPIFLGIDGVWSAISVAEFLALIVTIILLVKFKNKYHYA